MAIAYSLFGMLGGVAIACVIIAWRLGKRHNQAEIAVLETKLAAQGAFQLFQFAEIHYIQKNWVLAREKAEAAFAIVQDSDEYELRTKILMLLTNIYRNSNDIARALESINDAVKTLKLFAYADHPLYEPATNSQVTIHDMARASKIRRLLGAAEKSMQQHDFQTALNQAQEAVDLARKKLGLNHWITSLALFKLGRALALNGNYAEARNNFRLAEMTGDDWEHHVGSVALGQIRKCIARCDERLGY
ncbi:MAG: tetratricopeptide repeat protein [Candidatus Obscuribacterales bacterium]|nr:tetratricopeptide repeat protein [Candidatus Obscuribacterales bacterium]